MPRPQPPTQVSIAISGPVMPVKMGVTISSPVIASSDIAPVRPNTSVPSDKAPSGTGAACPLRHLSERMCKQFQHRPQAALESSG